MDYYQHREAAAHATLIPQHHRAKALNRINSKWEHSNEIQSRICDGVHDRYHDPRINRQRLQADEQLQQQHLLSGCKPSRKVENSVRDEVEHGCHSHSYGYRRHWSNIRRYRFIRKSAHSSNWCLHSNLDGITRKSTALTY